MKRKQFHYVVWSNSKAFEDINTAHNFRFEAPVELDIRGYEVAVKQIQYQAMQKNVMNETIRIEEHKEVVEMVNNVKWYRTTPEFTQRNHYRNHLKDFKNGVLNFNANKIHLKIYNETEREMFIHTPQSSGGLLWMHALNDTEMAPVKNLRPPLLPETSGVDRISGFQNTHPPQEIKDALKLPDLGYVWRLEPKTQGVLVLDLERLVSGKKNGQDFRPQTGSVDDCVSFCVIKKEPVKRLQKSYRTFTPGPAFCKSDDELLRLLNTKTTDLEFKMANKEPVVKITQKNSRVSSQKKFTVNLGGMEKILGFQNVLLSKENATNKKGRISWKGKLPINLTGGISSLLLYSNLVDYTFVTDTNVPLLCQFGLRKGEYGITVEKNIMNPMYVPTKQGVVKQCHFEIYDDTGSPANFLYGKTTMLLDFRYVGE